jgi:hypothetical protein
MSLRSKALKPEASGDHRAILDTGSRRPVYEHALVAVAGACRYVA